MKLIIGGAYQGKLTYAKEACNVNDGWIDGAVCGFEDIWICSGIFHFHEYVKRLLQASECLETQKQGLQEQESLKLDSDIVFHIDGFANLEQTAETFAEKLLQKNPKIVIVSNELGYGIVPLEKKDRLWREVTGRMCTGIATRAEEVVRVVCGVGVKLK